MKHDGHDVGNWHGYVPIHMGLSWELVRATFRPFAVLHGVSIFMHCHRDGAIAGPSERLKYVTMGCVLNTALIAMPACSTAAVFGLMC